MNPIELLALVGRVAGVAGALAVVGWITRRRIASSPSGTDPIRTYLDREHTIDANAERMS
jgi:hypothetical protein